MVRSYSTKCGDLSIRRSRMLTVRLKVSHDFLKEGRIAELDLMMES